MFKRNRHTQTYNQIVTRARSRELGLRDQYYEKHHVIPASMGGSDADENLVLLTAREHFLCHLLLTRMTEGRDLIRMNHAFAYMALCHSGTQQRRQTGRWYELARKMAAQQRDPAWGQAIGRARKGKKAAPEAVAKMRASLTGRKLSAEHKRNISLNAPGFSENSRKAMIKVKSKTWIVEKPDGQQLEVTNLKQWCRENGVNYSSAATAGARKLPVSSGPLKGWCFTASP